MVPAEPAAGMGADENDDQAVDALEARKPDRGWQRPRRTSPGLLGKS